MGDLLQLEQVSKSYGNKEALKQVSLTLPKGKVVGLLGPNGSGKSTMIKLINGLLQPTEGQIKMEGKLIGRHTKEAIAYLPERTYLNDWMKVKELIQWFKDFYTTFDETAAYRMIEDLKIDPNSKLKTLSKGTKEKVQLILVMARRADLYILDEPIGGVDPAARDYILNTIIKNYSEDSTILLATHLIQEVENICDEVIFLGNGEIVMSGTVDNLREKHEKSIDALFREVFRC